MSNACEDNLRAVFIWMNNACEKVTSCVGQKEFQFFRSFLKFSPAKIWEAHAEPKCKFFY